VSLFDVWVLEGCHLEFSRNSAVTPFQDFVIGKFSEGLEDILSEKLPDYSEDEFLLSVDEIDTTNVGKGDFEELSDFEGVVGVLNLDNSALGRLGDLLPVDTSWEKLIFKVREGNSVLHVLEEVVDVAVLNVEGVDPHLENSLFLTAFRIVLIKHLGSSEIFLSWGESWAVIEQLSTEDQVQFWVTSGDVLGSHEGGNSDLLGVTNDSLGSLFTFLLETTLITFLFVELVKEVDIGSTILKVFTEVVNLFSVSTVSQVVIHPSV
jgi:hypothetical protein